MIAGLVSAACILAAALVAFLALECLLGTFRRRSERGIGVPPAYLVLMPAHDEAHGLARPVRAILAQLRPCDQLVVIADNCMDDTAVIARSLGATVLERRDPDLRGKGYALEFARERLRESPGDVVIIVDADCMVQPHALARLAASAVSQDAVVQGAYLMTPQAAAFTNVRLSCFAFLIKNLVRQRGLHQLSGAALLQGSGMAFPRRIFDKVEWRGASLVEDLDMGLNLLIGGERVIFEDKAVILSDASSEAGTAGQRRRWEHGMLDAAAGHFAPLLGRILAGRWRLAFVALDLLIPPTVMLLCGSLLALAAGAAVLGAALPVLLLAIAFALLAGALARAWKTEGREMLPLRHVGRIPAYIIWKLPIIASFLFQRQRQWIRTEREP